MGEIAVALCVTVVLLYRLYSKDRFRTIGAAAIIGAISMFFSLLQDVPVDYERALGRVRLRYFDAVLDGLADRGAEAPMTARALAHDLAGLSCE